MRAPFNRRSVSTMVGLLMAMACGAAEEPSGADLLALFPDSHAPTFHGKKGELVVQRRFRYWERNAQGETNTDGTGIGR